MKGYIGKEHVINLGLDVLMASACRCFLDVFWVM